jgi:hypothetical protein
MVKHLRWILPALAGLLILGLVWFGLTTDPKVTALRNVAHYKAVKALGGPKVRTGEPPGAIMGVVRDDAGQPVVGAEVLVASPLGHAYTAQAGPEGRYRIENVPPGRYVPVAGKRGYDDALPQTCIAGLCWKHAVRVRPDGETRAGDLTLTPAEPPEIVIDDSLVVSPSVEVEISAPLPGKALRTHLTFERAGLRVNDCYLYEPVEGEGPLPTLFLVLPGPVLNWEIAQVPFADAGFSVLVCYPLRGIDLDEDAADLLTALEYLRQGRVPSRADTERLGFIGASFSSLHVYRMLGMTDAADAALVLGGMADGFSFRRDVEMGTAHTRPPFDQLLMALGFPNSSPELYFKHSVKYHLEGLPPLCLLHGKADELSPFSQSVELAEELERRGMPYEFFGYEGLSHYFAKTADDATTQQMFQDSVDCLRRWLESK